MLHSSLVKIIQALSLCKPPPHTLSTLIACITQPLMSLGLNGLHDLTSPNSGQTKRAILQGHRKRQNSTQQTEPLLTYLRQKISPPVKFTSS